MNANQIIVAVFGLAALAVSVAAIWSVVKAPRMRYKPLWIAGSLVGFVGFSVVWTSPDDLYLQFGVQIPGVLILSPGVGGLVIVKTAFPLIAILALVKSRSGPA